MTFQRGELKNGDNISLRPKAVKVMGLQFGRERLSMGRAHRLFRRLTRLTKILFTGIVAELCPGDYSKKKDQYHVPYLLHKVSAA